MSYLEELRRKPKQVRTQYAFFGALSVTLLITLVWGFSLPARFADTGTETGSAESSGDSLDEQESTFSEFGTFFSNARDQLGNILDSIDIEEEETEVAEEETQESEAQIETNEVEESSIFELVEEVEKNVESNEEKVEPISEESTLDEFNALEKKPESRVILIGTTTSHE